MNYQCRRCRAKFSSRTAVEAHRCGPTDDSPSGASQGYAPDFTYATDSPSSDSSDYSGGGGDFGGGGSSDSF